jgi:hypothetical protein
VTQVFDRQNEDGSTTPMARIVKDGHDASIAKMKVVPVDRLLGWQQPETEAADKQASQLGQQAMSGVGNYDHLFEVGKEETAPEVPGAQTEHAKNPRLEELFAPVLTVEDFRANNPQEPESYDHLFMDEGPERDAIVSELQRKRDKRHMEEQKYPTVTDESRADAVARLRDVRTADREINRILATYEGEHPGVVPDALVDAVRTDADLRYKLGDHLYNLKLTTRLHQMPDRVRDNTQKNPNSRGYSHLRLRSQEYATLLALAMIDGTFIDRGNSDPIVYAEGGKAIVGQHRAAAELMLY